MKKKTHKDDCELPSIKKQHPITYEHIGNFFLYFAIISAVVFIIYTSYFYWTERLSGKMMQDGVEVACTAYPDEPPKKIIEKVEVVVLLDEWKCDVPKMTTDLLQPSGYWIGDTISCWKLQTPIKQYLKEQCAKTRDDYFCKDERIR